MKQKSELETQTRISLTPHSNHRAYHNGRRFKRNDEVFEVIEGAQAFIEDRLENVVRFKSLSTDKNYEMEENLFFSKISEFELMSTQVNLSNFYKTERKTHWSRSANGM